MPEAAHNWTKIGAIAAVAIIPITIIGVALPLLLTPRGEGSQTSAATVQVTEEGPRAGEAQPPATTLAASECISQEGAAMSCASADALFVTSASTCDVAGVTTWLGLNPRVVELLLEVREVAGQCGAAPTGQARAAGATASDLVAVRGGHQRAGVMACLVNAQDVASVVPCGEPHLAEPVTAWLPVSDASAIQGECSSAAASFVARRVDIHGQALTSGWLTAQSGQTSIYRCLVKSTAPLHSTVYGLSGRPLPTVRSR